MGEAGKYVSASDVSLGRVTKEGGVSDIELEALRNKIKQLSVDTSLQEKVRWALEDQGALKKVHTVKQMVAFSTIPATERGLYCSAGKE